MQRYDGSHLRRLAAATAGGLGPDLDAEEAVVVYNVGTAKHSLGDEQIDMKARRPSQSSRTRHNGRRLRGGRASRPPFLPHAARTVGARRAQAKPAGQGSLVFEGGC